MSAGENQAWKALEGMAPGEVSRNAAVSYDAASGAYCVRMLSSDILVAPAARGITACDPSDAAHIGRMAYFLNISVLWYLVLAKDIGLSGRLVRPEDLKDGRHFFSGSHELPLGRLAQRFGSDREGFIRRSLDLGGAAREFGDAAFEFRPVPRVAITVILRLGDEEFPARADLLFDSSADLQAPLDVNWSLAMYTVLTLLS